MQGNEVGGQTEEGENLTSLKEVEVVEVEAEAEAEVEVGKEELISGMMTTMISALILDPLVPADLAEDEAAVLAAAAVQVAGMAVEEGEVEIEAGTAEAAGKALARLSQGPWQGPVRAQSQVMASGRR